MRSVVRLPINEQFFAEYHSIVDANKQYPRSRDEVKNLAYFHADHVAETGILGKQGLLACAVTRTVCPRNLLDTYQSYSNKEVEALAFLSGLAGGPV